MDHQPSERGEYDELMAELIDVGKRAVDGGFALASGGNLSIRGPDDGQFTVTGKGTALDRLQSTALGVMTLDGTHVRGVDPSSEWRLHQQVYRARPDATAIVHLHPEFVVLLDAIGEDIRQLTLDHVAYADHITRVPFYPNGSEELGVACGEAAATSDRVVMANHGCFTVSQSPFDALRRVMNMESAARASYRLLLLGDRTTEFPQELRATAIHR